MSLTLNQLNDYKRDIRDIFNIGAMCHQSHQTISDKIREAGERRPGKGNHNRNTRATAYDRGYIDGLISAGFDNISMALTVWVYFHETKEGETKVYHGWMDLPPELRQKYPSVQGCRAWKDDPTKIYYGVPDIMTD